MFRKSDSFAPRRLTRRPPAYVPNEIIVTTVRQARNDDLPHYLSVTAGAAASATSYGDAAIDGVLQQAGLRARSVSRVFVPEKDVAAGRAAAPADVRAFALNREVSANYVAREDKTGLARTYRITFETDANVPEVCAALAASKAVEGVRPNFFREALVRPSDEFYGFQWGPQAIGCEAGWEVETGHEDTMIAIVDSGIDLDHEDLAAKLDGGYDFVDFQGSGGWRYQLLGDYRHRDPRPDDEDGHGSHCAGIAASDSDNGRGVAGVCWKGSILPVRVMFRVHDRFQGRETSVGTDVDIDAGIKFAVDAGADVINLSLGGADPSHEAVLAYARDQGAVVVAATGNENSSAASYPASDPRALAVGAVNSAIQRASFSNYGPAYNRFVMAPGVEIASTYRENGYVYLDGTSMATPFVAGLAGLMVSLCKRAKRTLPPDDIYNIIRETATPLGSGKGDVFFGEGLVNVPAALQATAEKLSC